MFLNAEDAANQRKLKAELQATGREPALENFAAAALGRLMEVPVAVARSGFQHGGDAGPGGRLGRRFRIECKKYSDGTSLSDRELLGEIDHALARDEALEAWILVATKSVPEQLLQDLDEKAERTGVPIITIDWQENGVSPLAALCAFAPDLTAQLISRDAGILAEALRAAADASIEALRRGLQAWSPGYEALRGISHSSLENIWSSPRTSAAELGQDAAGGARTSKVRRRSVHDAMDSWWNGAARGDAPAAILGFEGVGKTWAVLDWLNDKKAEQPIVLIIPSSAAARIADATTTTMKRFIGERLYEIAGVRDAAHWMRRLEYLLKRPAGEGPIITLVFDGLNQEPSVPWLNILKVLQGDAFVGRVRVIVTTRTHHFDERLSMLRGLVVDAVPVAVDVYDDSPGGELDQMLAFEGLARADLHPDLVEFARTPRLFKLVVHLRDRLADAANVTLHGLLWEYGRDTFGERAGKSFSEAEWREWLKAVAEHQRAGIERYSLKTLAETASRGDLSEREVYARLSDIVDGQFAKPGPGGAMQLAPHVVLHALGAALLTRLDEVDAENPTQVESETVSWLDPIAGLDQRAEILRAAVSIFVARGEFAAGPAAALVTAWLQTQNITDGHRRELAVFAPEIPDALLSAVERSDPRAHASARLWAVNALRAIPRENEGALAAIMSRASTWLSVVSRDVEPRRDSDESREKHRADRYTKKLGKDESGAMTVLGVNLQLVDNDRSGLHAVTPSIIEGFPIAKAMRCFEAAAVASSVRGPSDAWKGLKWLCHLNEKDPVEAAEALRALSADIHDRRPEPGIHPDLPARAASLLLWLSGLESDEEAASASDPGIDRWLSYEKDYLENPSRSIFALERRHAVAALEDKAVALAIRVQRTASLWLDPDFKAPAGFADELREAASTLDVGILNSQGNTTREDHVFEQLEPALARCAPDLLADLMRRKVRGYRSRPAAARYWTAVHANEHWLLAEAPEAKSTNSLRSGMRDGNESNEAVATGHLLMIEIKDLDPVAQYDALIAAGLKFIFADFREVLKPLTAAEADILIARHGTRTDQAQRDLVILLSIHRCDFSDEAWLWLLRRSQAVVQRERGLLFRILAENAAVRFGRELLRSGWAWDPEADLWASHYGSGALIEAGSSVPFDQLIQRLAPWRVLEAARRRGADAAEVRMAAEVFGHVLAAVKIEEPDPGSELSVDRSADHSLPFMFSAEPRPNPQTRGDHFASLKAAMDGDAIVEAHRRASETAAARIEEARLAGASLYLANVDSEDFGPVIRHAPEMVVRWLDGCAERSNDFRRRVRLAEAAYLSLCEALLASDPERGTELWRALRSTMTTRYIGAAGVEELLHIAFRVPQASAVEGLRRELLDPLECDSDQALNDLALAASLNGNAEWLQSTIESDMNSPLAWRRKRGLTLSGFTAGNDLPVEGAWPDGQATSDHADLRRRSARNRWTEACARHWWRAYLAAADAGSAYAAWILFRNAADMRAKAWMRQDIEERNDRPAFFKNKLSSVRLNRSKLEQAMKKRPEKLDGKFLGHDIVEGIGPWLKAQRR
jgi:hypothetical protein